jgi:hypothetical protein
MKKEGEKMRGGEREIIELRSSYLFIGKGN